MTDTPRLEELKRRVQRDPASISFAALAEEYRRLGMFAEAIETCRAGLLRHPGVHFRARHARPRPGRGRRVRRGVGRARAGPAQRAGEPGGDSRPGRYPSPPRRNARDARPLPGMLPSRSGDRAGARRPAEPVSAPVRIAVKSASGCRSAAPPALVELEAFLAAIVRARRDVAVPGCPLTRAVP